MLSAFLTTLILVLTVGTNKDLIILEDTKTNYTQNPPAYNEQFHYTKTHHTYIQLHSAMFLAQSNSPVQENWLNRSFEEHSILWLLATSTIGGLIGAFGKLTFEVIVPNRLQERRELINLTRKHSTPILLAAEALRNRLANMIRLIELVESGNWLSYEEKPTYYYISTIYLVGRFFGWLEILRSTVVYLDKFSIKETRRFEKFLEVIEICFSDPAILPTITDIEHCNEANRDWCFSYELCAIGELMIYHDEYSGRWKIIGFSQFNSRLFDSENIEFKKWFDSLSYIFRDLEKGEFRFKRIIVAHAILNCFIDYMDPKHIRADKQENHLYKLNAEERKHVELMMATLNYRAG